MYTNISNTEEEDDTLLSDPTIVNTYDTDFLNSPNCESEIARTKKSLKMERP